MGQVPKNPGKTRDRSQVTCVVSVQGLVSGEVGTYDTITRGFGTLLRHPKVGTHGWDVDRGRSREALHTVTEDV